jgi:hypothetical protein
MPLPFVVVVGAPGIVVDVGMAPAGCVDVDVGTGVTVVGIVVPCGVVATVRVAVGVILLVGTGVGVCVGVGVGVGVLVGVGVGVGVSVGVGVGVSVGVSVGMTVDVSDGETKGLSGIVVVGTRVGVSNEASLCACCTPDVAACVLTFASINDTRTSIRQKTAAIIWR